MKKHRVLNIDAGFANCGWSVLDYDKDKDWLDLVAFDCIVTKKEYSPDAEKTIVAQDLKRIRKIYSELMDGVIMKYKPNAIYTEMFNGGARSARATKSMAYSLAVIACIQEAINTEIEVVQSRDLKAFVKGRRYKSPTYSKLPDKEPVSKNEVMYCVEEMYGNVEFPPKTRFEHIADSIIIGQVVKERELSNSAK